MCITSHITQPWFVCMEARKYSVGDVIFIVKQRSDVECESHILRIDDIVYEHDAISDLQIDPIVGDPPVAHAIAVNGRFEDMWIGLVNDEEFIVL